MIYDASNRAFSCAVKFVNQTNRNIFLTGKAGTGKTTFLKYIRAHTTKNMVVLAPTGVAAVNAGGVTIHSFFQLPFAYFLPSEDFYEYGYSGKFLSVQNLLARIKFNPVKRKLIEALDTIIIDEVSMVRADMIDAIDHLLRHIKREYDRPFGGVQMVFIGDLFQLPPVLENESLDLYHEFYPSPFFFDSNILRDEPPLYIELNHIYRQNDDEFIRILNNIRNNAVDYHDLRMLNDRLVTDFHPGPEDNYITLTTHNYRADAMNSRALAALPGEYHEFTGEIKGDFNNKNLPAEYTLRLKPGAQVMFIKNDVGELRRYFNGKIGTVTRIADKKIYVKPAGEKEEIQVEREVWKNIRYALNPENGKIIEEETGSFSQYPLRLAWSITIHKSQGLTFEKAIIDAGSSFAPGQVYVALSRLTSLDGLILKTPIHESAILTDEKAAAYCNKAGRYQHLEAILKEEQGNFLANYHSKKLDPLPLMRDINELHVAVMKKKGKESAEAAQYLQELMMALSSFQEVYKTLFSNRPVKSVLSLNMPSDESAFYYFKKIEHLSKDIRLVMEKEELQFALLKKLKNIHKKLSNFLTDLETGMKIKLESNAAF